MLTNFSDINLGCKRRVASGLDWVFSQVERSYQSSRTTACPASPFFPSAKVYSSAIVTIIASLLIGGTNLQFGISRTEHSYYFSHYAEIWGCATWRRAWNYYDVTMKTWPAFRAAGCMRWVFENPAEQGFWEPLFQQTYEGKIDTWDYIWFYTCLSQSGLTILPNVNLISNLGFGPDATHTFDAQSRFANVPTSEIWEVKHLSTCFGTQKRTETISRRSSAADPTWGSGKPLGDVDTKSSDRGRWQHRRRLRSSWQPARSVDTRESLPTDCRSRTRGRSRLVCGSCARIRRYLVVPVFGHRADSKHSKKRNLIWSAFARRRTPTCL